MAKIKAPRVILLSALLLGFFWQSPIAAYAGLPEQDAAKKGIVAAESTYIDRSGYTDPSQYENEAVDVSTVRIGLHYGDTAVEEAEFINCSGEGFSIGIYDSERVFSELDRTGESNIIVTTSGGGANWYILIDQIYESQEKADGAALAYGGRAEIINGEFRVLYGDFSSAEEAERIRSRYKLPGTVYTPDTASIRVISGKTSQTLYTPENEETSLAIVPLSAAGEGLTEYCGNRYRGGFTCTVFNASLLTVVNYVGLENYVKGVIPYEMNYNWPYEALKAQAVCARTYVVYNQDQYAEYGFDITDDTMSQVYRGTLEANETTDAAVEETEGEFVRYKGEICEIYYSASDGGATESGKNVFGSDRPYLTGKTDPFEQAVDYSMRSWTIWRSGTDISRRLTEREYNIGTVTALEPVYSDTGNVIAINFIDDAGNSLLVEGRDCYTCLGLNNCRFTVEQDGESFSFQGSGLGHNCGMSQWGANAMASVYGYDYEDIIRFYFTGAYIA